MPVEKAEPADFGGPFSLVDQDGMRRTDAEFRGKYMLVYDNLKCQRRRRELPITDTTAALIIDQQRQVRDRFPDAHITYLVEPGALPVVAGNPHIDNVMAIERRTGLGGLRAETRIIRRLRAQSFDVAIDDRLFDTYAAWDEGQDRATSAVAPREGACVCPSTAAAGRTASGS